MNRKSNIAASLPLVRWLIVGMAALPFVVQPLIPNAMGVTSPRGGETVEVGDTVLVAWNLEEGESAVNVVLWTANAGAWVVLTSTLGANDSTWKWVPSEDDIGTVLRVGVSDSAGAVLALCRGYFSVQDSGSAQKRVIRSTNRVQLPVITLTTTPNPGRENMVVEWGTPVSGTLQLVGMNGAVVSSYALSEQKAYALDPNEFAPGLYLAVLRPENGVPTTERIVIR